MSPDQLYESCPWCGATLSEAGATQFGKWIITVHACDECGWDCVTEEELDERKKDEQVTTDRN